MKHIKLMAEYGCRPLWMVDDPHYLGDIDPRDLPLSEEIFLQLEHWSYIFADTLVWDDPARSGFKTKEEEDRWDQEGVLLWKKLQQELSTDYQIDFFFHGNVFSHLEDFERAYPGQYQT